MKSLLTAGAAWDAVLFDMDGTLADTVPDLLLVFNAILARHGASALTGPELVARFGPPEDIMLQGLLPHVDLPGLRRELAAESPSQPIAPHAGMPAVVAACRRQGARIGVFTGAGRVLGAARMARLGLNEWVDAFVTADDIARTKPHPDGLLRLAELLPCRMDRSVYIGDSPLDLQSARAAGCRAIGVTWGAGARGALAAENPDALVDTVDDLAAVLGIERLPMRSA